MNPSSGSAQPATGPSQQLALDLIQPLQPTLDNFVAGSNVELLDALRQVAGGGGQAFVTLWGDSGAGRSHLLQALAAMPGAVLGAPVPVADPTHTLYLVDDADRLDDAGQRALFMLQNEVRARPAARLVATCSAPPLQLALREDLRTRLGWGLVYQVHPLTDADKRAALRTHADSRGVRLADDVLDWMLAHLPRDMRRLVAVLDALDGQALARRRAITLPLARAWLQGELL